MSTVRSANVMFSPEEVGLGSLKLYMLLLPSLEMPGLQSSEGQAESGVDFL